MFGFSVQLIMMLFDFSIDLNPVKIKYYPFMISLKKCNGICNAVDDLSIKIYLPNKTKI